MRTTRKPRPVLSARPVITTLTWQDLRLGPAATARLERVRAGMRRHRALSGNRSRKRKRGYHVLFHGPAGSGKTLTAALLGQGAGATVYRVDLSQIVSKYVGETEKNLGALLDRAESLDVILLLDEADALLGQRTTVADAHDRYASLETAYLLEKIESHPGILILTTNARPHLDPAFTRRLQAIIEFALPTPAQRRQLWQHSPGKKVRLGPEIDLASLPPQPVRRSTRTRSRPTRDSKATSGT